MANETQSYKDLVVWQKGISLAKLIYRLTSTFPLEEKSALCRRCAARRCQGLIATLATDHAPFDFDAQKRMGEGDFTKIPNGIPSLENRVDLYFTHGVKRGHIDLQQFVATASTNAAKIFGLFPRKGAIQLGSDADLVVYDPNYRGTISAKTHQMNLDYNSFEGMEIEGRAHVVTVRGKVAARDGKFTGEFGRGQFLQREPTHF